MAASKTPRVRLLHIRDEIDELQSHIRGVGFDDFAANYLLLRATERAILIISEAVRTLADTMTANFPDIPWQAIRGIGNIIRHEYERVDPRVLWDVITHRLPPLRAAVATLIDRT